MDRKELKNTIRDVFYDIIEKSAFMFGEEVEKDEVDVNYDKFARADMGFVGDAKGEISIMVPEAMCPEIAANFLGVDPEDEKVDEYSEDALKEILNVTCGHVLTAIKGERAVFDLTVPNIKRGIKLKEWEKLFRSEDSIVCMVDDYPVLIKFSIKNGD